MCRNRRGGTQKTQLRVDARSMHPFGREKKKKKKEKEKKEANERSVQETNERG